MQSELVPFAYYARLSPARQRIYRRSDAIRDLGLPPGVVAGGVVDAIRAGLPPARFARRTDACQQLIDMLVAGYHVPPIRVRVLARRPSDFAGELHGLYEPAEGRAKAKISVWMRTAQREQVVAFRSFLRTLVHELCHHLDYELYALEETFHTEGFYERESRLANALFARRPDPRSPRRPSFRPLAVRRACPERSRGYHEEPRTVRNHERSEIGATDVHPVQSATPEERCNSRPPRTRCQARGFNIATALVEPRPARGTTRQLRRCRLRRGVTNKE